LQEGPRQNRIIVDLIDVAQFKKREYKLKLENVDLEQVLLLIKKEIEPFALERDITIKISVEKSLPEPRVDFEALKCAF
jgi:signal transduction histidine kinase